MVRRWLLMGWVSLLVVTAACSTTDERADQTVPPADTTGEIGEVGDAGEASTVPTTTSEPEEVSTVPTTDQIDEFVGDDGVDADEALTLFAGLFGPIPGYEDVPAMVPADGEVVFGDQVLGWIRANRADISDGQWSAILEVLDPPEIVGGPGESLLGRAGAADAEEFRAESRRLQGMADEVVAQQAARWGFELSIPVVVRVVPFRVIDSAADTQLVERAVGTPNADDNGDIVDGAACYIRMRPSAIGTTDVRRWTILHHEIFHCFQLDRLGVDAVENVAPEWYHEGAAAFVGVALGGDTGSSRYWWNRYLTGSGGAWRLHDADYDAFGFWSELQADGVDVFGVLRTVFDRRIVAEADLIDLVEGHLADGSRSVGLLATRAANQPTWGGRWRPATSGLSLTASRINAVVGAEGATSLVTPTGNAAWEFVALPTDHVRTLEVDGYGAFRWGEETALDGAWSGRWCNAQPCECPDGTPVPGGPWTAPPSSDPAVLQMGTLGETASTGTVTTTSIEDLCRPPASEVWIVIDGEHGGRFSSASTPPGWCTAEHSGGSLMVSLGDYSAAGATMATVAVPFADGTVLGDGNVGWTVGGKSYWAIVTVQLSGTGGSFSGWGLDPYVDPRVSDGEFAVSGSFDCGHGGQPPTGAPWPGY